MLNTEFELQALGRRIDALAEDVCDLRDEVRRDRVSAVHRAAIWGRFLALFLYGFTVGAMLYALAVAVIWGVPG